MDVVRRESSLPVDGVSVFSTWDLFEVLHSQKGRKAAFAKKLKCVYFLLTERTILALFEPYTHTYKCTHTTLKCALLKTFSDFLFPLGQHCLDPDAYMLDVYHVNPQAEWVIKPQPSF